VRTDRGTPLAFALIAPALAAIGFIKVAALNWGPVAGMLAGGNFTALANQAGNYINQAGLADAAGVRGVGSAVTGAANNYLMYDAYKQGLNPGTGGYDAVGNPYSKPNTLQAWQAQQGVY
jgi:hypothetical protein